MIYLDTSFLTPLFREEATSAKVAEFLSRQAVGSLAVAHNNGVEFIATLDDGMLSAAKKLKIPARRVIR